ncbi:hypothetical protein EVAR_84219_1 [Eumeta japonica]|uniref:Retrovirus-related Pol polyprotein from type-1 retrotransposable element R1 4 n=1 Tax=Eumeta variegata TaxID=151549 RepID=A0A4C1WQH3_EUMVA|nr:hypothetical protein EVAR_84219_1 [Eumeta japonica]
MVKASREKVVNILSDSRSSLELLSNPRAGHPLAHAIRKKLKPTPVQTQIFTGHTGIAEYLHRFKLLQSPSCECDADKIESVWHIILECPRYEVARYDLEHKIETKLENKKCTK